MTDSQLEVAARKYCEAKGLDPESMIEAPSPTDERGFVYMVYVEEKRWKAVARRLNDVFAMNEAIRFAMESSGLGRGVVNCPDGQSGTK